MKRYGIHICISSLILFFLYVFIIKAPHSYYCDKTKKTLYTLYQDIDGFNVGEHEYAVLKMQGAVPTYGEITYKAVKKLLQSLQITHDDVFYDLGSGVGKMVMQVYLSTPVKKAVGIELSPTRHNQALKAKKRLGKMGLVKSCKLLSFEKENFADVDLSDATVIYFASTCFDKEFMKKMTKKFGTIDQKRLRVITLNRLPKNKKLSLEKEYTLPMTWSDDVLVYVYKKNS